MILQHLLSNMLYLRLKIETLINQPESPRYTEGIMTQGPGGTYRLEYNYVENMLSVTSPEGLRAGKALSLQDWVALSKNSSSWNCGKRHLTLRETMLSIT
ncbi:MAG: hypothetical protein C0405_10650 [Desulfovibrio sp.]|nr:hypothetical protein [Desulfovibrio sp.]